MFYALYERQKRLSQKYISDTIIIKIDYRKEAVFGTWNYLVLQKSDTCIIIGKDNFIKIFYQIKNL